MNVLEKILEEIEERVNFRERLVKYEKRRGTVTDVCRNKGALEELDIIAEIIRSHMSEKEKVSSAEIISWNIDGKPCYGIKFKKVGEDDYTVGYGSYKLDYVINWLNECFEFCGEHKIIVNVGKDTNVPSNNGWIPVEERLPESKTHVLCCFENGTVDALWQDWKDSGFGGYFDDDFKPMEVVAWRPLPEPYKPKKTIPVAGMDHIMSRFTKVE